MFLRIVSVAKQHNPSCRSIDTCSSSRPYNLVEYKSRALTENGSFPAITNMFSDDILNTKFACLSSYVLALNIVLVSYVFCCNSLRIYNTSIYNFSYFSLEYAVFSFSRSLSSEKHDSGKMHSPRHKKKAPYTRKLYTVCLYKRRA